MAGETAIEVALAEIVNRLGALGRPFAVVGGLGVTVRAEPRFTRDVDIAVSVTDDRDLERLVLELRGAGYSPLASVEQTHLGRLATVRLASPSGVVVDLVAATCGLEADIVARATPVAFPRIGPVAVASAEDLLAMKVLSMSDRRPQDRADAVSLLMVNEDLDLEAVRTRLAAVTARGFARGQDLAAKLEGLLASIR